MSAGVTDTRRYLDSGHILSSLILSTSTLVVKERATSKWTPVKTQKQEASTLVGCTYYLRLQSAKVAKVTHMQWQTLSSFNLEKQAPVRNTILRRNCPETSKQVWLVWRTLQRGKTSSGDKREAPMSFTWDWGGKPMLGNWTTCTCSLWAPGSP